MLGDTNQHNGDSLLLEPYGDPLKCYRGEGTLSNHHHSAKCRFTAGQLRNGEVVILCDFIEPALGMRFCFGESPDRLEGSTIDGWEISASGNMMPRNWLPEVPKRESVCVTAFRADRLSVTRTTRGEPEDMMFGVTNFCYCHPFSCPLEIGKKKLQLEVRPTPGSEQRLRRLRTVRGTDVTTEVRVTHAHTIERTLATEVIDDFCHVASVALGTHIQWVFTRRIDPEHSKEHIEHYDRFTKPYCGLAVIDPRSAHRKELPAFIASAIPRYRERKDQWSLNQGPISAYLDAKSEGDLLETRAAKISVAIEMLKTVFIESGDADVSEYIIDPGNYDLILSRLQASCRDVLGESCTKETANAICSRDKLEALNRRSFRHLLNKLSKHVGFSPSDPDMSRFVDNRNSLVHTGRFLSDDPLAEWLFLLNMLDRLYLKLLGYSGPYLNWTRPVDDRRDSLK